jgi:hypothetical protein
LFATVIPEKLASQELDASVGASGPHDFAVRIRCSRQQHRQRPPHPAAYVRDDRETPLCVGRDGGNQEADLVESRSKIFLRKGLDSQITDLVVGLSSSRNPSASRQELVGIA